MSKKYGLVWEDENYLEKIVSDCQHKKPILKEIDTKKIIINKSTPTNIIIEGDNYEALYILNQTHKEKIDIIYIDPPYNTNNQNEFQYNNKYIDENDVYKHSKWLSFMNNRLKLAKNLLNNKGVIFISINNTELAQLKLLCDEIFGDENLVAIFPRLTIKGGKTQSLFSTNNCDYLLCYANNKQYLKFNKLKVENDPSFKYSDKYVESRGMYHTKQALDTQSLKYHKSADYIIKIKDEKYYPGKTSENNGYIWTWSYKKFQFAYKNDFVDFKNGRIWPKKYLKAQIDKKNGEYYIKYVDREKNYSQLTFIDNKYSNPNGTNILKNMQIKFDYPKPISLIKTILKMVYYEDNIIVLDFFAGSGTTGHAVLELNKEDNKNRKFILCTNNENNICIDVCYPRIEKAIKGYTNLQHKKIEGLGSNLKYFKVNFSDINE